LKELKLEEFASSLGLPGAPRIKFIKGDDTKERKNASWRMSHLTDSENESGEEGAAKKDKKDEKEVRTRYDRMFERRNQDVLAGHYSKLINDDGTMIDDGAATATGEDADEDADFLSVKRVFAAGDDNLGKSDSSDLEDSSEDEKDTKVVQLDGKNELTIDSKRREKLLKSKKKLLKFKGKGTRLVYDEEGNAHEVYEMEDEEQFKARGDADTQRERFLAEEAERTRVADLEDKEVDREKRREKKEKRKARERALAVEEAEDDEEGGVPHGLPYVPFEIPGPDSGSEAEEKEEPSRPSKKQRVSFAERGSDSEEDSRQKRTKGKKAAAAQPQIETLADLEALASGLLG
jgi:ATP-dependent RNA helicase DDX10/DBP4